MEDLREVLGVLRGAQPGDELAPQPDLSHLPALLESSRAAGVAVSERIAVDGGVPAQVGRTVYRVVQEALTNAHKHSRGATIDVDVQRSGSAVTVVVTNVGPVSSEGLLPGSGYGLVGLQERVGVLGGTLRAGPTASGGWAVTATIPLTSPAGPQDRPAPVEDIREALPRR
jgi:signal transduction histidine kinase